MSSKGETYFLPKPIPTDLAGDIAFAPSSGPVWPMKNWAYYDGLKSRWSKRPEGECAAHTPIHARAPRRCKESPLTS